MREKLISVPYNIFGVKLWSVENAEGFIFKYCDTKQQALDHILNMTHNPELIGEKQDEDRR